MRKRTLAARAAGALEPLVPQGATQGHGAAQAVRSRLQRIAELHAELADAYGDLAAEADAGLAVLGKVSVHASVPTQPKLLTPAEVAELLQVHPRTLRRLELAGEIPPPIGGEGKLKRWRRTDLREWGAA